MTRADAVKDFIDDVLRNAGTTPVLGIGPVVWDIEAGHDRRHWYFMIASADANGAFHLTQLKIAGDDRALAEETRGLLLRTLIDHRVVTFDFDDELRLLRFSEQTWPCDETRRLRRSVESERMEGTR